MRRPAPSPSFATICELLRRRAENEPERLAYTFLLDGESAQEQLDYAELDRRARAIGARLQGLGMSGERVLLLYPPGLDYVSAVFGCLYANAAAILAFPPRLNRPTPRLLSIVEDARPKVALTNRRVADSLGKRLAAAPELKELHWLVADDLPAGTEDDWQDTPPAADDLAFMQYTSGSTGSPKGVLLSHANVLHNLFLIDHGFAVDSDRDRGVIWLPIYHDMGLMGGVLAPVYVGIQVTLLSPASFLQRPVRWLEAISNSRGTISGGPDFAYQLCVDKVTAEQRAQLDLSRWRLAFSGAEPIRPATLERFAATFAECGFSRDAFYPCYGMAETTLIVTGGLADAPPVVHHVESLALERHRVVDAEPGAPGARAIVGCGRALPDLEVVIVHPETCTRCSANEIGEVWVGGPSVAQGYWQRPEESAATFQARLADTGEGPYLRTGDLGFLRQEELFITGRIKDLIIIRGRNHYPQDIELIAEKSHPALRLGCAAAFSVDVNGEERLVVVLELERRHRNEDIDAAIRSVRGDIAEQVGLVPHAVVLIQTLSLPKTSSGKVQRYACRAAFLAGELKVVAQWREHRPAPAEIPAPGSSEAPAAAGRSDAEIRSWLVAELARRIGLDPQDIDVRQPFARYGLDSAQAMSLTGDLEQWLGRRLEATLVYEHPSVADLARHLALPEPRSTRSAGPAPLRSGADDPRIAIVGIGCRFPGARGKSDYWRLLREGVDAISEVPPERWDLDSFYHPDSKTAGKIYSRWGGFLDNIDQFDPRFFGITHREAACIDPQQRLLLEIAWEALEDAGLVVDQMAGSPTGVFVGISTNEYSLLQTARPELIDAYGGTGNALSVAANRLSYTFDFQGPSLAVDTACSSSLVAVHLACRSLAQRDCDLALAGGANLILSPALTISFSQAGALALDGRCKTFDARADGFVRSEGVGCVVLKRLPEALADGDHVYAVVRGSAVNQDGRTNGLMAPSRRAQETLLRKAYQAAGVAPGDVDYVEAHGTGTLLGDPIEAMALGTVLGEQRSAESRCALGSVKTNIGHAEAAAGIAGLIKVALALEQRQIPASLHYREANPHIAFDELPIAVQAATGPWPDRGRLSLAGVSSFGFGGTNAHVVVEEAPVALEPRPAPSAGGAHLVPLSAHIREALTARARDLAAVLRTDQELRLADLAHTAATRRAHLDHRLALVAASREELIEGLEAFVDGAERPFIATGRRIPAERPKVSFVFCGQGPQRWAMGRELAQHEGVFLAQLREFDRLLAAHAEWSLLAELAAGETESRLNETAVAQPALVALQIALAALWRHWGVVPDAVVGHSIGEVAAAHVAGALSLEEAVRVAFERGRIMQQAAGQGVMAAVALSAEEIEPMVERYAGRLSIAAFNAPASVVLSGEAAALNEVLEGLRERDVWHRRLPVDYAFHSPQMEPFQDALGEALSGLAGRPAELTLMSTVTGATAATPWDANYWREQIRQPVRFAAAISELLGSGHDTFLEIGPHPVLSSAITECLREGKRPKRGGSTGAARPGLVLASLRHDQPERTAMLRALAALYCRGQDVEWRKVLPGGRLIGLPAYPWQRERCWLEAPDSPGNGWQLPGRSPAPLGLHPLLGRSLELEHLGQHSVWENELDTRRLPYLEDHRFQGAVVFPASGYLEAAVSAAGRPGLLRLTEVSFHAPLVLSETASRRFRIALEHGGRSDDAFRIFSRTSNSAWTLHASGQIQSLVRDQAPAVLDLEEIRQRCSEELQGEDHYVRLRARGFEYGPSFQAVRRLWRQPGEALGKIEVPAALAHETNGYYVHPALLDACGQVLLAAASEGDGDTRAFLPAGLGELLIHDRPGLQMWSHARLQASRPAANQGADSLVGDAWLLDDEGRVLIEARELRLQFLDGEIRRTGRPDPGDWLYELTWQALEETAPKDPAAGTWLLFADSGGCGQELAALLAAAGSRCVLVHEGAAYANPEEDRYTVRPGHEEDLAQLLKSALTGHQAPCRGVVYLWGLHAAAPEQTTAELVEHAVPRLAGTVLYLLQGLVKRQWMTPPRLWLVTRGAETLAGDGNRRPAAAQSPLWGFGRTAAQEHPATWGGLIDLEPSRPAPGPEENHAREDALRLYRRLGADDGETQVAFREGEPLVARLTRWRPPRQEPDRAPFSCRPAGSYLITGGLGALGFQVARWLVDRGARHLVLAGRTELPPRAEWSGIDPGSRIARQVEAVRQLESLGASVHLASLDIASEAELSGFLERYRDELWPPIRGVVHAAGVLEDRTLLQLDASALSAVFRAKVLGGWLLDRLLAEEPLDFFVMFSSTAALLGSAGQANYAAANAFLDALAYDRRSRGKPALVVDWGPWAEAGFAARSDRGGRLAQFGIGSIEPEEGLDTLGRLLQWDATRVGVTPIDWTVFFRSFPEYRQQPLFGRVVEEAADEAGEAAAPEYGRLRDAVLEASDAERQELLESLVRDQVARVVGMPPGEVDVHQPLNTLGIDSLMGLELKNRVESELGITVPAVQLFEGPSIERFAELLEQRLFPEAETAEPVAQTEAPRVTPIQPEGSRPPFFCFHPGALDVRCYEGLARHVGPEQPFLVLHPPELDNYRSLEEDLGTDQSLQEVAARCLRSMREIRPRGPYRLGGWSMGGVLAFLVAHELDRQGEEVALLALFDSPALPFGEQPTDYDDAELLPVFSRFLGARSGKALPLTAADFDGFSLRQRFERILAEAKKNQVIPADSGLAQIRFLYQVYKNGLLAAVRQLWTVPPLVYPRTITLFRTSESLKAFEDIFPDSAKRWGEASAVPLVVREVPGDHYTMFLESNVKVLAERLRDALAS